jgi:molecular chaperone Hsp33
MQSYIKLRRAALRSFVHNDFICGGRTEVFMSKIIRAITSDGSIVAYGIDSKSIVARAADIHKPSAVVTAALGRLLTATSIMGIMLKGEDDSVTVRICGDGPAGRLTAVSDSSGNVRGLAGNPQVELPLNQFGKLDVSGAVGKKGTVFVTKDLNLKEPYNGQTAIVSGEIAEDITGYFAASEQIPTVCALGVLVDTDLSVKAAGGYIIQLLPYADPAAIDKLEENIKDIKPVTSMLDAGLSPQDILRGALDGFEVEILDETAVEYKCNCSDKRVRNALKSLDNKQLQSMIDEQGSAQITCRFCDKVYNFTKQELEALIREKG